MNSILIISYVGNRNERMVLKCKLNIKTFLLVTLHTTNLSEFVRNTYNSLLSDMFNDRNNNK